MRPSPNDPGQRLSNASVWVRMFVLSIASLPIVGLPVAKAEFQTLERKLENAKANSIRSTVRRVLTDPAVFRDEAELTKFNTYYTDFLFPAMTQTSPRGLGIIGKARDSLFRNLGNRRIHTAAHRHLTKLTFDQMKQIATENFHPVARYNAVITLGRLDQQPAAGGDQPPVPLAEAADVLLDLIQPDAQECARCGPDRCLDWAQAAYCTWYVGRACRPTPSGGNCPARQGPPSRSNERRSCLVQTLCAEALAKLGRLGDESSIHKALLASDRQFGTSPIEPLSRSQSARQLETALHSRCGHRYRSDSRVARNAGQRCHRSGIERGRKV